MTNPLDKLAKGYGEVDETPAKSAKTINTAKRRLRDIYQPLTLGANQYSPERTVNSVEKFIKENPVQRIFYSEISSFISGLSENGRATVSANLDTLVSYVIDNEVSSDIQKICIKIYDHFQLNLIQFENAKAASDKAIAESITGEKEKLHSEVKSIEKEYITILGIFVSIMLAFVGGFTFSTSVLNNVSDINLYTLVIIALVIGLVFVILITILLDFLREINDKVEKDSHGKRKKNETSIFAIILLSILITVAMIGGVLSKTKMPEKTYIEPNAESQTQSESSEAIEEEDVT